MITVPSLASGTLLACKGFSFPTMGSVLVLGLSLLGTHSIAQIVFTQRPLGVTSFSGSGLAWQVTYRWGLGEFAP